LLAVTVRIPSGLDLAENRGGGLLAPRRGSAVEEDRGDGTRKIPQRVLQLEQQVAELERRLAILERIVRQLKLARSWSL
jgi:hypothetical protein